MHTPPKFFFDLLQLGTHSLSHGLPKHDEPSLPILVTYMGEAQEIEGIRLAFATPFPIRRRITAKFDQAGFLGMQFQIEHLKSFLKFFEKLLGLMAILEANHKSSSPGESHPQALTEPYVNVSAHTALIVQSPV